MNTHVHRNILSYEHRGDSSEAFMAKQKYAESQQLSQKYE